MDLGEYQIDDYVDLVATTHRFSSGAAYAPTGDVTYTVYENANATQIITATAMTNFDSETGLYYDRIQLTAALGYEVGKSYMALIKATIDGVASIDWRTWRVKSIPDVNVITIGGTTQTAKDLGALEVTNINTLAGHDPGATLASTSNITAASGVALTAAYDAAKTAGTSTLTAQQVWEYATRTLSAFGFSVTLSSEAQSALVAAIEVELANDSTGQALMQAIADKLAADFDIENLTVSAIAIATRDAILNRVLAGNHDTAGTPGKLLQNADAAISSRLSADSYTAPDNTTIGNINAAIAHATYGLMALQTLIAQVKAYTDKAETMLVADGEVFQLTVNALENAPAGEGGGSAPTIEQIDAQLTSTHGSGSWGAGGTVVLPVMQGLVYTATAIQGREVVIVQGDTPRVTFDLDADYTGWTPYFAAKAALADTAYAISPKACSWSAVASGQGYVDLTATETGLASGKYFAEIELRNGDQRLTAMKFTLKVIDAVIKE